MTADEFITRLTQLCVEAGVEMRACGCCDGMSATSNSFYLGHIGIDKTGEYFYNIDDEYNKPVKGHI